MNRIPYCIHRSAYSTCRTMMRFDSDDVPFDEEDEPEPRPAARRAVESVETSEQCMFDFTLEA